MKFIVSVKNLNKVLVHTSLFCRVKFKLLRNFLVKKMHLSQRVGYVVDGSMGE